MNKKLPLVAIALLAGSVGLSHPAEAQIVVTGARSAGVSSPIPVTHDQTIIKVRSRRRDRNPYFAARPVFPPAAQGARANVTFEPYTRWYYSNENSYYPPLPNVSSIRSR